MGSPGKRLENGEEFTYGGGKWAKLGFMMLTAKRVEWAETNAKLKVLPAVPVVPVVRV